MRGDSNSCIAFLQEISRAGHLSASPRMALLETTPAAMRLDPVPPFDVLPDGTVNVDDLLAVIHAWGVCAPSTLCAADVNDDGAVNIDDLLAVIMHWRPVS
jgi:Dockerin type I domain